MTINKTLLTLALASIVGGAHYQSSTAKSIFVNQERVADQALTSAIQQQPRIQVAILLDTSSSMNGLIDQTRNQLWSVINEFSVAKRNGQTPKLEVALFEYGNSGLSRESGYIRKLNHFTGELDLISEGLFSLQTNGGDEYCGMAVKTAVDSLQWSQSDNDIKVIFIAGNEPFTQGPVNFKRAISSAKKRGIAVNTIFAGNHDNGVREGWQQGALLAGGDYMSIDANRTIVHIDAPQDKQIESLNSQLNETYVPYGALGRDSAKRQVEQDQKNSSVSKALLAKRAKSKSSSYYRNSRWDLVDAMREGEVDEVALAEIEKEELPEPMQEMNSQERMEYVAKQAKQREKIQAEIGKLSEEREQFVRKSKQEQGEQSATMSDALSEAVRKQAAEKGFELGS